MTQYKDAIDVDYQPICPNTDNTIAGQLAKYQPESMIAAREFMRDLPSKAQTPKTLVHFTELIDKEKYQEAREWKIAIINYVTVNNNHTTNTTNSHNVTIHYSLTYNITHNHPQRVIQQQLPYTPPQPTHSTVDSRNYDHCISINNSGDNARITATSVHVEGGGVLIFVALVLGFIGLGIAANN